jgi:hypothetical protein
VFEGAEGAEGAEGVEGTGGKLRRGSLSFMVGGVGREECRGSRGTALGEVCERELKE